MLSCATQWYLLVKLQFFIYKFHLLFITTTRKERVPSQIFPLISKKLSCYIFAVLFRNISWFWPTRHLSRVIICIESFIKLLATFINSNKLISVTHRQFLSTHGHKQLKKMPANLFQVFYLLPSAMWYTRYAECSKYMDEQYTDMYKIQ